MVESTVGPSGEAGTAAVVEGAPRSPGRRRRASFAAVAVTGLVVLLVAAGCSKDDPTAAPDGTALAPPGIEVENGTTRPPATGTTLRPTTTTARTSSSSSSTTSSTVKPSSTTSTTAKTTTSTASGVTSCGDVALGQGGNAATGISAVNTPCNQAAALVGQVAASHSFSTGPSSFTVGTWSCTASTDPKAALPTGVYSCSSGNQRVSWARG